MDSDHHTDHKVRIARAVKAHLDEAGVSENAVAQAAGIPQTSLNRCIRGLAAFNVGQLGAIADYLGISVVDLISKEAGDAA